MTPAGYPVPAIPDASVVMTQPLVGCSSVSPTLPVVSTPKERSSSRAAAMDQYLLWSGSSFGGESAGRPLPLASLTPRPTGASPHVGESDAEGGGALWRPRLVSRGAF